MEKPDKKNIQDIFALTPMQEGMLFHYLKDEGSSQYFEQLCLDISGDIDIKLFQQAWNVVIETNEMLRTAFRWKKIKKPVQVVFNTHSVKLKFYDLSHKGPSERKKFSHEIITKDQWEKFDLYRVPFRVTLCKIHPFKYRMIISNHHILYDGWSNGIILREFFTAYINLVNKKKSQIIVKTKFKEFVKWLDKQDKKEQEKFWKMYLKGFEGPTELPVKIKPTGKKQNSGRGNLRVSIKKDTREKLEKFISRHKITMAALLYCTWGILLQAYNNTNDVIFGTTVSGRSAKIKDIENVVGLFINTVPLRLKIENGQKIKDLLYHVNDILVVRKKYECTPLVDIKGYSQLGNNPELFDSIVVLENYPLDRGLTGEMVVNSYSIIEATSYDLTVGITMGEDIEINFSCPGGLFEEAVIRRLSRHFINIMENILADHERDILNLEILSEKEKKQVLDDFNRTVEEYPENKAIHELFEEQVDRTPDNIALVFEAKELTYRELNKKSDKLTRLLRERGVGPGTIVGIMVERSPEMIKGILAILKAGGAYLPIDPDYPEERVKYMINDSGAKILLTTDAINPVPTPRHLSFHPSTLLPFYPSNSSNLAYIIYTSGSTGKPKGVMVETKSVVNILLTLQRRYPLNESDVYAFKTPYIFDVSVTELFGWFLAGGKLAGLPKGDEKDPQKILDTIQRNNVTHINFVPSMFNMLAEVLQPQDTRRISGLKYIFLAGETLLPELVNKFRRLATSIPLENLYGPTEGTVYASYYSLEQWDGKGGIPIGKPVANTMLVVLDKTNRLQPIGVPGELCISGAGLARGYLNQPELTAERFCLRRPRGTLFEGTRGLAPLLLRGSHKDYMQSCNHAAMQPCSHAAMQSSHSPHSPIYKTGDLAYWLPDGNMAFLGRIDQQVKIRGFRIEPGEIENQLLNCKEVKEALVTIKKDETGGQSLCAYIVPNREPGFNIPRLKHHLEEKLPGYMIPAYFAVLEEIPLTPGGKVDRKSLPEPDIKSTKEYCPPGNDREKLLVDIWANLLQVDKTKIGVNDNFFELGGHSLKATLLMAQIHKKLDIEIPLSQLFKSPTIRGLTLYIDKIGKARYLSIEPVEEKEYYVLSSAQERLYFLHQAQDNTTAYNMTSGWLLAGALDKKRLENAFQQLIRRHDSLRTSFWMIEEELVQRVHEKEEVKFAIEYYLSPGDNSTTHLSLPDIIRHRSSEFVRPFDLSQAPLLRVGVIKFLHTPAAPGDHLSQEGKEYNYVLMIDMHHIISDGVSAQVLIRDFTAFYPGEELPGIKFRYRDYVHWQEREKKSAKLLGQGRHWQKVFAKEIPVLELPTDYARPAAQWFQGSSLGFEIDRESTGALKSLALEEGATLYMVLFALFNIFLAKISSQEDIVIGTPVAGRKHADLQKIIGMFVNTLPIRNFPLGEKNFSTFLAEIKENTLLALENQEYPYEDLVEHVIINRDMSRNPIFDVCFLLQNMEVSQLAIPGMKLTPYEYKSNTSKFDLTLEGMEIEEALLFQFEYSTKLFKPGTIERFVNYFKNLVSGIRENKKRKLSQLEIISGEEKHRILYDFNDTKTDYPKDKTLHQLFEEQVERNPDDIALLGPQVKHRTHMTYMTYISYRELNDRSDEMVRLLIKKGVKPDTIVGIMVERSIEMIIGILGILKARGAYLPIDPDYPRERIDFMLKDSNAEIFLTDPEIESLSSPQALKNRLKGTSSHLHSSPAPVTSLAYVIYTSGSTGRPRGVLVEHKNVARLVIDNGFIEWKQEDRLLPTGAFSFDITTFEIWAPLLNGIPLVLVEKAVILNGKALYHVITAHGVTHLHLTPRLFEQLAANDTVLFGALKCFLVGGDRVNSRYLNQIREQYPGLNILHMYGPTENTTFSTFLSLEREYRGSVPIGKPIANSFVYIVDKYGQYQPIGVTGEIWTAGDGVARGYLNNPELTAERFCLRRPGGLFSRKPPPWTPRKSFSLYTTHSPIYKTGDLGRWLEDGNIEFLGRVDHQVKIRGYRIELEEIETRLLTYPGIKDAVVLAREDKSGDKYLCAYIVRDGTRQDQSQDQSFDNRELKEYLFKFLPDYMVPAHIIRLDELPLTPTGKTDRRALPAPGIGSDDKYTAPRDELEKKLADIWADVLLLSEPVSIDANFFQSGGHSLKAMVLQAKIHKAFNVDLPLTEIFKRPSIRGHAQYIGQAVQDRHQSIESAEKKEYYALSSAQQRLFFVQRMDEQGTSYNMTSVWQVEGQVDPGKTGAVFQRLSQRHESLRTSFIQVNDEPVQRINEKVEVKVEEGMVEKKKAESFISSFIRYFDLSKAPLLRVGVMAIERQKHILLVDMHHIISDGISTAILIKEFVGLYRGNRLPDLELQYKDYSEWHQLKTRGDPVKKQRTYWLKQFPGEVPVLELPTDYPRPLTRDFTGNNVHFEIHKNEAQALKTLAGEQGVTLFMMLLSVYIVFLCKISNQEDIVVGTPAAGRRHADSESIIGMFVNTLALRNFPIGPKPFNRFLEEVKQSTIKAFENQDYQYEDLVRQVQVERDTARNPLFDTMFNLQNIIDLEEIEIPGLKLTPFDYDARVSKFDLALTVKEVRQNLFLTFEYCTKLFKKKSIEGFAGYFKRTLLTVLENPGIKISKIEIIDEEMKKRLLIAFNDTRTPNTKNKTIQQLFAEQVERTPDNISAIAPREMKYRTHGTYIDYISYRELNEKSGELACTLKEKGIEPGTIVGIMMERSVELIIGKLGILKAGALYLPIDLDYPEERKQYMLADSGAKILLSEGRHMEFHPSTLPPFYPSSPSSLAYVIYTSGSTGRPRGVLVEHKNVARLVIDNGFMEWEQGDRLLPTGAIAFDITTFEVWAPLLNGIPLVLVKKAVILNGKALYHAIKAHGVTHLHLTPRLFEQSAANDPVLFGALKCFLVGGDRVDSRYLNRIREQNPGLNILHMYGPTENTTFSTFLSLERKYRGSVPIGKPIADSFVYIVNKYGQYQPIGVTGEIWTAGDGVARGYLNNPELTAEKFCLRRPGGLFSRKPPPWTPRKSFSLYTTHSPHSPIYKTGDLGRWLEDGNIEFLGRIDHQVKIRGFRIELGEIENRLLKHEHIKEAVVIAAEEKSGDRCLCAYIAPHSPTPGQVISVPGLREYLSRLLPGYMIPSYFIQVDELPLTPTGKIDRRALPVPEARAYAEYIAPRDQIETQLANLWKQVLSLTSIGIDDNFFHMGGHSLKAITLISAIHRVFHVKLPLTEIFKRPTIRRLSQFIKEADRDRFFSIEAVEKKEYYGLSSAQQRLYFLQQMGADDTVYNMPSAWVLEEIPGKNKMERAFAKLIQRHESLRTSFLVVGEEPAQRIHDKVKFEIEYYEKKEVEENFIRPFNFSRAPLLRIVLIKTAEHSSILVFDMHHIISDAVSSDILIKDFMALYAGGDLPGSRIDYKDYAHWQGREKYKEKIKRQEAFWTGEFPGEIPVLDLPADYSRPAVRGFAGRHIDFQLDENETRALKQLALENQATLYIMLIAAVNILLAKISGQTDIVLGSPTAGRRHADLAQIIGVFVNTLALRNYPSGEQPLRTFVKEVTGRTFAALENQDYPFEDLVDKIVVNRDLSRNPLFEVMLVLQNVGIPKIDTPGLKLRRGELETGRSKFDLTFNCEEIEEKLFFTVRFSTELFQEKTIRRFIDYFKKIVAGFLENMDIRIREIEILSPQERGQLLYDFNDTAVEYPVGQTIHRLFENRAAQVTDNIAIIGPGPGTGTQFIASSPGKQNAHLTYNRLNTAAGQLANLLKEKGVKPDTVAAIMMERSIEMIIGLLAILKSSGAYLPISPDYPRERINYMLADSKARVLLKSETNPHDRNPYDQNQESVCIVLNFEHLDFEFVSNFEFRASNLPSSSLAYVIYTSGSTGKPKGVMVRHENVINTVSWWAAQYLGYPGSHVLFMSQYTFDPSVNQIFSTLLHGAVLYIADKMLLGNSEELRRYIETRHIHVINFVPSILKDLLGSGKKPASLRAVLSGGERLDDRVKDRIIEKGCELYNQYGPTETTIDALVEKCSPAKVTLGQPIDNVRCYIFDKYNNLTPVGVIGELCIGGAGVARGYLNQPELTAEKFDRDLWHYLDYHDRYHRSDRSYKSYILYRTGDLARWLPHGNVEFLGRMDHQVKVRGYRIELAEIETRLLTHDKIKKAVVLVKEKEEEKDLAAYIVPKVRGDISGPQLRAYLSGILPDYMIPSYFVEIEEVPLGANGKIDRRALPEPEPGTRRVYTAPRGEIEQKLVDLWREVLSLESIGIDDDFFQLGGHSLKATILAAKIYKSFKIRLPLREIFKGPTIRSLSQYIAGTVNRHYLSIRAAEEKEYYTLFSAQKRLYLLYQADKETTAYNMPEIVTLQGKIEKEKLENTFKRLIRRHEGLRTSFEQVKGEPVQRVHKEVRFEIEHHRPLASEGKQTTENRPAAYLSSEFIRPFDLTRAPLLRVGLMKLPHPQAALRRRSSQEGKEHKYLLIIDMHHIISDGVSMGILIREFMALSEKIQLPPLEIGYKDFSEWWNREKARESVKQQEAFWIKEFEGEIPVLQLPADYPRPLTRSYTGGTVDFELGKEETAAVNRLAKEEGVTLFMVLLALYIVLLARLSGQEDVVVGTPVVGRYREELYHTIGMFVNTLALRNFPKPASGFKDFLKQLKEQTLKALENQNYPFEQLVERVAAQRDNTRNPIFDVMFTLQNIEIPGFAVPGLVLEPFSYKQDIAKFDLNLICVEKNRRLCFIFEYSDQLFETTTIERFINYFKDIVKAILENRDIKLSDIEISLNVSGVEPTALQDAKGDFEF